MISSTAAVLQGNQANFVKFQETKVSTAPFSNKVVFYLSYFFLILTGNFPVYFNPPALSQPKPCLICPYYYKIKIPDPLWRKSPLSLNFDLL